MTTAICITSRNHAAIFFMSSKKLINANIVAPRINVEYNGGILPG